VKYSPTGVAEVTIVDIEPQGSGRYEPSGEQGLRWHDPQFGIKWPLPVSVNSEKDANSPLPKSVRSAAA
jgi:dTDP-4-dehydrorhamnose 3,5-epimerase